MTAEDILQIIEFNRANFELIFKYALWVVASLYILILLWLINDVRKRFSNPFAKILCILFVTIFNIPGLIGYLLFRPSETIIERKESKLYNKRDILLIEEGLKYCKKCFTLNKEKFNYCTDCGSDLKFNCSFCKHEVDPSWNFCPFCNALLDGSPWVQGFFKRKLNKYKNKWKTFKIKLNYGFTNWGVKFNVVKIQKNAKYEPYTAPSQLELDPKLNLNSHNLEEFSQTSEAEVVQAPNTKEEKEKTLRDKLNIFMKILTSSEKEPSESRKSELSTELLKKKLKI